MPRNVRNFYVCLDVDGRAAPITGGPSKKHGGIQGIVKMRHNGEIIDALELCGSAYECNSGIVLTLNVRVLPGQHTQVDTFKIHEKARLIQIKTVR